jgi:hemerythrin-like domain-containing protein
MSLRIGNRPDHGFDEPLGLLSDCHRRIEHFLQTLAAIAAAAGRDPLTAAQRDALEAALRYFAVAAPKHTADEEESLFPRLRAAKNADVREALALVERLEHEHDEADTHHAAVDALARRWLADDALGPDDAAALQDHLARLQALYRRHIALEDGTLFPAAAVALDAVQIRDIGREMAARRTITAATAEAIRVLGARGGRSTP